ncbi:hypothetical protein [Falsiphaeobacter marinintestinus]|uniref:hypothetical protein n=1 Tax=Falsiphaeobacter marinintestinus TaxID=1492905 RepID=UPI0011B512A1|nr:hypothetical protein [Phaeobacter marinintestinus]
MAIAEYAGTMIDAPTLDIIQKERTKALSAREWKFRLAGYGYGIKDVGDAKMLTKLPQNTELGLLPGYLV